MRTRTDIEELADKSGATILALIVACMLLAFVAHDHHYHRGPATLPQPIAEPLDLGLD